MRARLRFIKDFIPELVVFLRAAKKISDVILLQCDVESQCCDFMVHDEKLRSLVALRCMSMPQQSSRDKPRPVVSYFDCRTDAESKVIALKMQTGRLLEAIGTRAPDSPLTMRLAQNPQGEMSMLCELSSEGVMAQTHVPVSPGDEKIEQTIKGPRRFRVHQVDMSLFATAADKMCQFSPQTPLRLTATVSVVPGAAVHAGTISLHSHESSGGDLSVVFQMGHIELMRDAQDAVKLEQVEMLRRSVAERERAKALASIADRHAMEDESRAVIESELRDTITAMGYKYRHGQVIVEDSQLPQRKTADGRRHFVYDGVDIRMQYSHPVSIEPPVFAKLFVVKAVAKEARMLIHDDGVIVDGVTNTGCRFRTHAVGLVE